MTTTSRLKPSFSARPLQTAANVSVKRGPSASGLDRAAVAPLHLEILQPDRAAAGHVDAYGRSLSTMKPMFSRIGSACDSGIGEAERNRRRCIVSAAAPVRREAHGDAVGIGHDLVELPDVVERDRDGDVFLVRGREGVREPVGEHAAFELAARLDQRVPQAVVPGAHRLRDQALELVGIDARRGCRPARG